MSVLEVTNVFSCIQSGELVAENVTPKDENSKVAQHSKETFYVDVLDDRNNLWIGEFGDVTCCNLGESVKKFQVEGS